VCRERGDIGKLEVEVVNGIFHGENVKKKKGSFVAFYS
jgi:hypothetical protein